MRVSTSASGSSTAVVVMIQLMRTTVPSPSTPVEPEDALIAARRALDAEVDVLRCRGGRVSDGDQMCNVVAIGTPGDPAE